MKYTHLVFYVTMTIVFIGLLCATICNCHWMDRKFDQLVTWWHYRKKVVRSCKIMGEWK